MPDGNRKKGLWADPEIPKTGWTCQGIEDNTEPGPICEMCESSKLRYIHEMHHPKHHPLRVGCVCAGWMSGDLDGARNREKKLRSTTLLRKGWLNPRRWHTSEKGNSLRHFRGWTVVVYPRYDNIWGFRITHKLSRKSWPSKKPYESEDTAKLAAFDAIYWVKNHNLLDKLW